MTRVDVEAIRSRVRVDDYLAHRGHSLRRTARGSRGACPRCGGTERATKFSVTADGLVANCFGCGLAGDVFRIVQELEGVGFRAALKIVSDLAGGLEDFDTGTPAPARTPRAFPPSAEVEDVWSRCGRVWDDPELRAQLSARCIDPAKVEDYDLARVVPREVPAWARLGNLSWHESAHRLVLPMFDCAGRLVTLHARRVAANTHPPKAVFPRGFRCSGTVMACSLGRQILEGKTLSWWNPRVIVVEGATDFLVNATHFSDGDEGAPAVFGICSGGWNDDFGKRIPRGARVVIRTDHDPTGERYAQAVAATLGHCEIFRGSHEPEG